MTARRAMHFDTHGRTYHLRIRGAEDLRHVLALDEALWVATNAPIATMHGDERFFALVDTDRNGRITACEVRGAILWTLSLLVVVLRLVAVGVWGICRLLG